MTYEYRCSSCGADFEIQASLAEKTAGLRPKCPDCGDDKAKQLFSGFGLVVKSSAGAGCGLPCGTPAMPAGGCCGCPGSQS
jgi:putative FmdB family regulatory protein